MTAVCSDLSIPEQHLVVEAGEDVDYVAMPKASRQRASVLLYLRKAGYDIKLVDSDGFTRAMSQVKMVIHSPSGSSALNLFEGPIADLLLHAVKDLRSLCIIEPILAISERTHSTAAAWDPQFPCHNLIDHDHEEGTHKGSFQHETMHLRHQRAHHGSGSSNYKDPVHHK
ncbi:La-related protein 6 [Hordeum vulgare]|nr:La-related protein 6 [Hordeum vulgare]